MESQPTSGERFLLNKTRMLTMLDLAIEECRQIVASITGDVKQSTIFNEKLFMLSKFRAEIQFSNEGALHGDVTKYPNWYPLQSGLPQTLTELVGKAAGQQVPYLEATAHILQHNMHWIRNGNLKNWCNFIPIQASQHRMIESTSESEQLFSTSPTKSTQFAK